MLKVGITGGIGSGKTTVCKIFEALEIPVYYADIRAKALMIEDKVVIAAVKELLGEAAYFEDGTLNRGYVANIIFNDKEKLKGINSIVHPAVGRDTEKWYKALKNHPYTLREAAIMFETGGYKLMDKVITVYTPKEMRIERVLKRDKTTRAAIEARIDKQMSDEEKVKLADYVVYNDGSKSLIKQVLTIHHSLTAIKEQQQSMENHFNTLKVTRQNVLKEIASLTNEQLNKIPEGFNNNLIWNVGHLLVTQQLLIYGKAGKAFHIQAELIDKYKKGSKPTTIISDDEIEYIKTTFLKIVSQSEEDYKAGHFTKYDSYPTSYGITLRSVKEAIIFNNVHEGLHLGYIKALRKLV